MKKVLQINSRSNLPKYQQIIQAVIEAIEKKQLQHGDRLPSINELAAQLKTARVTIAKAYESLREQGTILSQHGKGFFVANSTVKVHLNVFLLFDTFNPYKEILYHAMKAALPADAQLSLFFHHRNLVQFESLIRNGVGKYNYYVIMPHFDEDISAIIGLLPGDKLLLLDKDVSRFRGVCAAVYQDFKQDIIRALAAAAPGIKKYKKLHLILGKEHFQYVPSGIIQGARKFCQQQSISMLLVDNLREQDIRTGEVYLIFSDADLMHFVKYIKRMKWEAGKDIGLISFDDTPMKEILLNGVSVISTDFEQMGKTAGEMISEKRIARIANPGRFIKRSTL